MIKMPCLLHVKRQGTLRFIWMQTLILHDHYEY